jgi:hypothetical protein
MTSNAISIVQQSKFSLRNKRRLYVWCALPTMKYLPPVWAYDLSAIISSSRQVRQNKLLRPLTDAPWFMRNDTPHNELRIVLLVTIFKNEVVASTNG